MTAVRGTRSLLLVACLGLAAASSPASAHVILLESEPADGAVLSSAPETVTLRFADPVMPGSAQLIGADTVKRPIEMKADGDTLLLSLPRDLKPGTYVVSWVVSSFDNHPVDGSLVLVVGQRQAAVTSGETVRLKLTDDGRSVDIGIQPATAGRNRIEARFQAGLAPKEVAIELSQPAVGIKPIRRVLQVRNGVHVLDDLDLVVSGPWKLTLDVLIDTFDKAFFDAEISIR